MRRPPWSGSITRRGKRFLVRWTDQNGERHSKTHPSMDLARRALAIKTAAAARAQAGLEPDPAHQATLAELVPDWIVKRVRLKYRDVKNDRNRWNRHVCPAVGHLRPDEVAQAHLRALIDSVLASGAGPTTAKRCLALLSTIYSDLVEDGHAKLNPVRSLSKKLRGRVKSAHNPEDVPFLQTAGDIEHVYARLPPSVAAAFAIGALAGLRTGEVVALRWSAVDLERGRITVRERVRDGKLAPPKGGRSRWVPIQRALLPVLREWRLRSCGELVIPPDPGWTWAAPRDWNAAVRVALQDLGLMATPWAKPFYQATRHTFASQWAMAGRNLRRLQRYLGHVSFSTTERYAHLAPDAMGEDDVTAIDVDLGGERGRVLKLER